MKAAAREAARVLCRPGVDIARLALQFSVAHPEIATTIAGSANPANIRRWSEWIRGTLTPSCSRKFDGSSLR